MGLSLNAPAFRAWASSCVRALGTARAEIDALNVFPVPDGDTGTNVYLTFVAGEEALDALPSDTSLADLVRAYVDGLLTGAKGNSGVILSQLVRASFRELAAVEVLEAADVARAFGLAADAAYAAVGRPVEGTILSVARAGADGAADAAARGVEARATFGEAARAAREALQLTPSQMPRLARAGVVDAGGRALTVVLDATEQALTGRFADAGPRPLPVPLAPQGGDDLVEGGPSYEVMYLLRAGEEAIAPLRATLDGLGDSLVVVGGDGLWNVHVHVDDVGAAIEAGIAAGAPYRIAVTHFADQVAGQRAGQAARAGRAVVAATTGDGMATLCAEAGATTLQFTREQPLTVDVMTQALLSTGADEVVVLPNNPRYQRLFEAAAQGVRTQGVRVAVIPTVAQVQGLAALAVHDAGRPFDDDVVAMSSAAAHTLHGAITVAAEAGMTMAGPCSPGDVLGVVAGDFAVVGQDAVAVATEVLDRILSPGAEIVTIVTGSDVDDAVAVALAAHVQRERPDVDTVVYAGGQENYPLFLAVE